MAFEIYKPRLKGVQKEAAIIVSLSKNSIVLNKPARVKLENPEYVELAYDIETKTIRIKPTTTKDEGLPIKKSKIYAKGFYNQFGITAAGKYYCDYNADENAVFVTL